MKDEATIRIGQAFLLATIALVAAVLTSCEGFTIHGEYGDYTFRPKAPIEVTDEK